MIIDEDLVKTLLGRLFPINRSLTGPGNRETLGILSELIPLSLYEVPSGTKCYDWTVPPEWRIREAWIKDKAGKTVVDFANNNLHVVNGSTPFRGHLTFKELKPRLHTLPKMPTAIPYKTTYYKPDWGFCLSQEAMNKMDQNSDYEVCIDSSLLENGSLTYADSIKRGDSGKEYLISTYLCHPSLANDNLSGLVLATLLFRQLLEMKTRHSYRLVIVPETIGAIVYLSQNRRAMTAIAGGYVITTVAGPGPFGYKESFLGSHEIDSAAKLALSRHPHKGFPFVPDGSDERQYSSPGFRIPTGTITKDKYYDYKEYHTSLDNLEFISPLYLLETLDIYRRAISYLEMNVKFKRIQPHCEFMLGPRGLYPNLGGEYGQPAVLDGSHQEHYYGTHGKQNRGADLDAMQWWMFAGDGQTSTLDLSLRSGMSPDVLFQAAKSMEAVGLLMEVVL